MTCDLLVKFIHVTGALGFFVALSLEWTSLRHLRHAATVEYVRERMRISNRA